MRRIILLGKTGAGKSSLANIIFGEKGVFIENSSANSVTKTCQDENKIINGRQIRLVDTPGLFDTVEVNSKQLTSVLLRCIEKSAPGPHAFLIVLKVDRYTQQEQAVVDQILKNFSEKALKYTTVVFTHGNQLEEGQRIEDWVKENGALNNLAQKCGGRCHVFDNKHWNNSQDPYRNNQVQVKELLETIEKTVRENGGEYYTNTFLKMVICNMKMRLSIFKDLASDVLLKALLGVGANRLAATLSGRICSTLSIEEENKTGHGQTTQASAQVHNPPVSELHSALRKRCSIKVARQPNFLDLESALRKISASSTEEPDMLKIILLGKDGTGKSSLANTIFGDTGSVFKVYHSPYPENPCQSETRSVNGRNIQLIDTPGFFVSQTTGAGLRPDMLPELHAFLLVFKLEQYSKHDTAVVDIILQYFSKDALKYTTVVFTHGDNLPKGTWIEEWVSDSEVISNVVQKCGGRCHVFDNKYWRNSQDPYRNNQVQLEELLKTIDKTVTENGGCYIKKGQQTKMNPPEVPSKPPLLKNRVQKCTSNDEVHSG